MKEIMLEWLKEQGACVEGYEWAAERGYTDTEKTLQALLEADHFDWANWCVVRLLTADQCVAYAIHAAELVLPLFESEFPADNRPRLAIEAAKGVLAGTVSEEAAARAAARAAAGAARAAGSGIQRQIIEYGMTLLKGE